MSGSGAPDDMHQAHRTQAWLAASTDPGSQMTRQYFYHMQPRAANPEALDTAWQDRLLETLARLAGVEWPD